METGLLISLLGVPEAGADSVDGIQAGQVLDPGMVLDRARRGGAEGEAEAGDARLDAAVLVGRAACSADEDPGPPGAPVQGVGGDELDRTHIEDRGTDNR